MFLGEKPSVILFRNGVEKNKPFMSEFYTASLAMKDKALFTHAELTLQDAAGA
jgi:hypothetical protein